MIEIVDRHSGGWGHINIDQILFSDVPPEPLLKQGTAIEAVAKAIALAFDGGRGAATCRPDRQVVLTDTARPSIEARSPRPGRSPATRGCAASGRARKAIGPGRRRPTAIR